MKKNIVSKKSRLASKIVAILAFAISLWSAGGSAQAQESPPELKLPEQKALYEAQQAMEKKDYATAERILTSCVEKSPEPVHYLVDLTLGNVLSMRGDAKRALKHYLSAAERNPSDAVLWQNTGKAYYDLKMYEKAGDSFAKAFDPGKPQSATTAYHAAAAYIRAERPQAATPLLEKLVSGKFGAPEPEWLKALLQAYMDLGRRNKALETVKVLLAKDGADHSLWKIIARLYIDNKDYKNAAAAMEVFSILGAPDRDEKVLLGDLYAMAGVPSKAARQYESLLVGGKPSDFEKAASAYVSARKPEKAADVLGRGLEACPTSRMWEMLAGIRYGQGVFREASLAFEQSARMDPKNPRAHLMMGYCALKLDDFQAARLSFSEAARFPAHAEEAKKMLEQLESLEMASTKEVAKEPLQ